VLRLLQRRIGPVTKTQQARISALPIDDLATLGEARRDFADAADLTAWLATPCGRRYQPTPRAAVGRHP
jgi:hypothetical protein